MCGLQEAGREIVGGLAWGGGEQLGFKRMAGLCLALSSVLKFNLSYDLYICPHCVPLSDKIVCLNSSKARE